MRLLFAQPRYFTLRSCLRVALQTARADLAFWRRERKHSKLRVVRQWAVPAVCWHLAANFGIWLGERSDRLPERVCRLLSYQERIKRR
jgi:hypothetical protein